MSASRETVSRALLEANLCLYHADADALTEARRWLKVAAGELDALVAKENLSQAQARLRSVLDRPAGGG